VDPERLDDRVYEAHVKGFTRLWPGLDERLRGTYAAFTEPVVTQYLQALGVTAVELLPVHHKVHDPFLQGRGLRNYWGYQTIGYFAPHDEYAALGGGGLQVQEFRRMVQALHQAGIEVILDVVFNHTAEGGFFGPTLAFRGFSGSYYHALEDDQTRYVDYTGCGNSLDTQNPFVLQLIMDSLRYWVTEMHVDGFRFDLAVTLSREEGHPDRAAAFFDVVQQDPVISAVKLIAEPWDIGGGGYQVGNFPWQWAEWNGKFRDSVRDLWRSVPGTLPEMATRFTGSADLYGDDGRRPFASVNFVTAHDGFTLRDLVSYNAKHNEANGEGNRDGESHNRSWNCGAEGPTDDPEVLELRARQQRNFLATLLLSQGVPMIAHGDEIGRTQHGNNNVYCQDNELSWIDWHDTDTDLLAFTRRLVRLRADNGVFRRRHFFSGQVHNGAGLADAVWFTPGGREMTATDWGFSGLLQLGVFLNGDIVGRRARHGDERRSDTFYLCFNAAWEPAPFRLPGAEPRLLQAPGHRPRRRACLPRRAPRPARAPCADDRSGATARCSPACTSTRVTEDRAVLHTALRRCPGPTPALEVDGVGRRAPTCTRCSTGWRPRGRRCRCAAGLAGLRPAAHPQRGQHRHRRLRPRAGDGLPRPAPRTRTAPGVRFVSNVDGTTSPRPRATSTRRDPVHRRLKTFTTLETMTNARTARPGCSTASATEAVARHFVAVSTNAEKVGERSASTPRTCSASGTGSAAATRWTRPSGCRS
jgi:isoamylase